MPDETGRLVGEPPTLEDVAAALRDVRDSFDRHWPPADEIVHKPARVTGSWALEHLTWSRQRDKMLAALLDFAVRAPLLDADSLEIESDQLMVLLRERAQKTGEVLIAHRGDDVAPDDLLP